MQIAKLGNLNIFFFSYGISTYKLKVLQRSGILGTQQGKKNLTPSSEVICNSPSLLSIPTIWCFSGPETTTNILVTFWCFRCSTCILNISFHVFLIELCKHNQTSLLWFDWLVFHHWGPNPMWCTNRDLNTTVFFGDNQAGRKHI